MNLPNLLSLFRLFITGFFILLVTYQQFRAALILFILQGISDLLDGFFARRMDKKTYLGAYLDPIADKVMLVSSYLVLGFHQIIPLWVVAIVMVRDLIISLGFLVLSVLSIRPEPVPSLVSKTTTVFQIITVVYVLWSDSRAYEALFFYATAALTIVSGFQYILVGYNVLCRKEIV